MKSLCIKTNNANIIKYLIDRFSDLNLDNIYISSHTFKIYDNVIIHYSGEHLDMFYDYLSSILTDIILEFYEPIIIKKELNHNFFYFSSYEKNKILELYNNENCIDCEFFEDKYFSAYNAFSKYIKEHHSIVLTGFFNFRLYEYHQILDYILSVYVNRFLIEREYFEFIHLLRLYINSNPSKISTLNLVYLHDKGILLNENFEPIDIKVSELLNAKFLSDISFSDNDYILNFLLNTLPSHIIIHVPSDSNINDEFIDTLKLIFEDRISICNNCNICSLYRYTNEDKTL